MTDVMARFQRLDGRDVMFLTGTDEHGEKVAKTAAENGMEPKEFADKNAATFVEMTKTLNISNDDFIRTSEERHHKASQAIWQKLLDKGDIYLGQYEGWYSIREEAYFTVKTSCGLPRTGRSSHPMAHPLSGSKKAVISLSYRNTLTNYLNSMRGILNSLHLNRAATKSFHL